MDAGTWGESEQITPPHNTENILKPPHLAYAYFTQTYYINANSCILFWTYNLINNNNFFAVSRNSNDLSIFPLKLAHNLDRKCNYIASTTCFGNCPLIAVLYCGSSHDFPCLMPKTATYNTNFGEWQTPPHTQWIRLENI